MNKRRLYLIGYHVSIAASFMLAANPVLAAGPASPAPTPPEPGMTITRTPELSNVGDGGCVQQYTTAINSLIDQSLTSHQSALTTEGLAIADHTVGAAAHATYLLANQVAQDAAVVSWGAMSLAFDLMDGFGIPSPGNAAGIAGSTAAMAAADAFAADTGVQALATGAAIIGQASTVSGIVLDGTALAEKTDGTQF